MIVVVGANYYGSEDHRATGSAGSQAASPKCGGPVLVGESPSRRAELGWMAYTNY
jgi:hypothetical protein